MILNAISNVSKFLFASSSLTIRGELQSIRDCFFALLIACTIIVAVGVILEDADDWLPSGKPILDMQTGLFSPSRWVLWRKRLVHLGWLLLIVGIIGEGMFEGATSWTDGKLQDFNNTLLAITTDEAGSAAKSARTAHDEAREVSTEADGLKRDLDATSRTVAEAEANSGNALGKAKRAQESLGKAQEEADRAENASSNALALATGARKEADSFEKEIAEATNGLKLTQTLISARHISDWTPFETLKIETKKVSILSLVNDDESNSFCKGIAAGIHDIAKIEISVICGAVSGTISAPGVFVSGPNLSDSQAVANAIAKASQSLGVVVVPPSQSRGDNLEIVVGAKNPFIVGNK